MRVAFLLSFVGLVFASQHVLQGDQDIQEALLDVQSQLSQLKDESPLIQAVTSLLDAGK